MSTVHVFGAPDESGLDPDERLCSDPERSGVEVVFHVATVQVGKDWTCAACGVTSAIDSGDRQ